VPVREMPVRETVSLLRRTVSEHPDVDAFVESDGTRISYSEWDAAADGVAAGLADRGVSAGDVVCLLLPSSIRYMVAYQASMRLGAVTTGINMRLGVTEISAILHSARPRAVIVDGSGTGLPAGAVVPDGTAVVPWPALQEWWSSAPPELPVLRPDDICVLCWTGGTTGRPKGVMFDHDNLRAVAAAAGVLSGPLDRRLSPLSFAHVGTMTRAWDEISRAMTTVLTPPHWSAGEALRLIEAERITVAQGVPTQWELMLRHPDFPATDMSSLRLAATGGSRVPVDLIRRIRGALGVPFVNRYASTEAAIITGTIPGDPENVIVETVGRPAHGVQLRITGDDGGAAPAGAVGRVQVRSPAVMRGYWNDPEATGAAIDASGWLTVGDLGRLDAAGNLSLVGRIGEMFTRGGYNIYPIEVERVLAAHPAVRQVSVVARPDSVLGEASVAFVVLDAPAEAEELRTWVGERLADYKTPDEVVPVDALPVTSVGKVDRRELADRASSLTR
jgi:acyl-CoA synthetase (AMP-forming)/AMP-acid ligase II